MVTTIEYPTEAEMIQLRQRLLNGDETTIQEAAKGHERLIWNGVKEFSSGDRQERRFLFRIGELALMESFISYDPVKGEFALHAMVQIRRALRQEKGSNGLIKISSHTLASIREMKRKTDALEIELKRPPSFTEIATKYNLSISKVEALLTYPVVSQSLDADAHWGGDHFTNYNFVPESISISPLDDVQILDEEPNAVRSLNNLIEFVENNCSEKERSIFFKRYGLRTSEDPIGPKELAAILGMPVSKIEDTCKKVFEKCSNAKLTITSQNDLRTAVMTIDRAFEIVEARKPRRLL